MRSDALFADGQGLAWALALATVAACMLLLVAVRSARWATASLRANADASLQAQRLERERISRELHDTFLQSVQTLTWSFRSLSERLPADCPVRAAMACALELAETTLADGRDHLFALRGPASQPHFADALGARGAAIAACSGVVFEITRSGEPLALHPAVNHEIARIAGEALANAFRHARATRIDLRVRYSTHGLCVAVEDDGRGIAPERAAPGDRAHLGLAIMRERARGLGAALHIGAGAAGGTAVELRLPTGRMRAATGPATADGPSGRPPRPVRGGRTRALAVLARRRVVRD